MRSPRYLSLTALSALLSLTFADTFDDYDPNAICYSYGIDFQDDQHYFINSLSSEPFTCVSEFDGQCNADIAETLLVDPNGDEHLCSQVDTTPMGVPKLSTCPILKKDMVSGEWMILVLGNNGDGGAPFAWQRDLVLDVGPQATTTYTPTVTISVTSTPIITSTETSTFLIYSTVGPTTTFTLPSQTAKYKKTVTPKAVTTTSTKTFTRWRQSWTKQISTTTKTVTAVCTVPPKPGHHDKPCRYSPTLIHPAAMVHPTGTPARRFMRKKGRAVDVEYARARINAAKLKRGLKARAVAALEERAPDAPTLTITHATPQVTTSTHTAAAEITTESTVVSSTTTTTLPPVTVYSGVFTSTVTAPTPTRTRMAYAYTTGHTTITIRATLTRTTTVTPSASISACKSKGGHFGKKRR